ncbi:MAG TPA: FKBP-type peptidyl-prolyl cis-trans isomerase [Mariprofundaceae bacterium]|nr:FKBP-type peptidyl-prolyl cis-trans isomerase [Mariprofundaceae bacterium]
MKRFYIGVALALSLAACNQQGKQADQGKLTLDSDTKKSSYAIGMSIGHSLKDSGVDVDADAFVAGARSVLEGGTPLLDNKAALEARLVFMQKEMAVKEAKTKQVGEANEKASEAFLAANKDKPGVKTTASGLQYMVLTQGKGPKPKATDTVTVNYRGTLIDGTEFDSSYKRGEPSTFRLNQVIPGWTEGLQLMPVGSKYRLFLPANLAYGEHGAGGVIGPNQALIFEVELLKIDSSKK